MNRSKLTIYAMLILLFGSCTKKFEGINTNPVLVTEDIIQPSMIFSGVLKNSIFPTYANSIFKEYANYYSNEASGAIFQDRDWTEPFSDFQQNLINIAEVVRLTADDPSLSNEHAIARIWKVWVFYQLTDAYGDLPYFEAVLDMDEAINQPHYNTQEEIYRDLFKELDEAVASFSADPSQKSFANADILFGGDIEKWTRFANSLRLRLAIRVRYADAALAGENVNAVLNQPLIDANGWNAKLATLNDIDINNRNPLYNEFINSNAYPVWAGFTVTQELLKRSDPRLDIFVSPASVGAAGFRGRPMTLHTDQKLRYANDSTAVLPLSFQQPVYDIIVLSAAEVYFLRAEAALAGLSTEDAGEMYRMGIRASLEQYNVDAGEITGYLSSPAGSLAGPTGEDDLENIIVQKYLAMYNQGTEAWAEYRRTGYPKIWTGNDLGST
ncbi:MAG: SusD/RagB family nutrient-binding outer membrane lipoprotein, partial [Chitinophagaceae bacterium]|nr:SusD/RagB family nutrient-binding outer membrane lipoprotein [Chitinophagaceae bacterium]